AMELVEDLHLFIERGIVNFDLEEESVKLRFGETVGSLLFDRVLRGDHHEGGTDRMGREIDRHLPLLHDLEQSRLRLCRGAVDLIDQHKIAEDRTPPKLEITRLQVEDRGSQYVRRHKIGGELDAGEIDREGPRNQLGREGLGDPRNPFDQDMAIGKYRRQYQTDHLLLTDTDFGDL